MSDALLGLAAGFAAGAIAGFTIGELFIRGPGGRVIDTLDDASRPGEHALTGLLGVGYTPLALLLGARGVRPAAGTRAAIETGRALPFRLWLALGVIAGGAAFGERRMRMPPTDVPPPGGPAWNPDAPNDLGTARR